MRWELDPSPSPWKVFLAYSLFVALALLLLDLLSLLYGVSPLKAYGLLLSPLGDSLGLAEVGRRRGWWGTGPESPNRTRRFGAREVLPGPFFIPSRLLSEPLRWVLRPVALPA